MIGRTARRARWIGVAVAAAGLAAAGWLLLPVRQVANPPAPTVLPAEGALSIAFAGDTLIHLPLSSASDENATRLFEAIRNAHIAIANLDENLLTDATIRDERGRATPRQWPFGRRRDAVTLKTIGFDVASIANDHGADYGERGLLDTIAVLREAGVMPVGAGSDLAASRRPVFFGDGARRIAIVAVTASSPAEARATQARGDIKGRPGINPLRYEAKITADAPTFDGLRKALPAIDPTAVATADQLTFLGSVVRRGDRTTVELSVDDRDERAVLDEIRQAHSAAEAVVVSLHAHEPSNESDAPAPFVREFAHAAIEAGAAMIVAHGPHRVRGAEVYKGGAIFYGVGNFLYQPQGVDLAAAGPFDSGVDLFRLSLGTSTDNPRNGRGFETEDWWQGLVVLATENAGRITAIRLLPIDLGVERTLDARGTPRVASAARAAAIVERLKRLSEPFGATVRQVGNVGVLDLDR